MVTQNDCQGAFLVECFSFARLVCLRPSVEQVVPCQSYCCTWILVTIRTVDGNAILPVLALLGAGIVGVGLARAARLSPLVGFFIVGAIVGPHAFGLVQENKSVHLLAEAGVAFFLFEVGLHLPLSRFVKGWKELFVLGALQVAFCAVGLLVFGRLLGLDWPTAALVGVVLSLSSTAVVLRLLQYHN